MLRINLLIGKKAADNHSDTFLRIINNTCNIKLTLGTFHIFIFAYISYQIYEIWSSCVTFYHLLNRFLQPNDN